MEILPLAIAVILLNLLSCIQALPVEGAQGKGTELSEWIPGQVYNVWGSKTGKPRPSIVVHAREEWLIVVPLYTDSIRDQPDIGAGTPVMLADIATKNPAFGEALDGDTLKGLTVHPYSYIRDVLHRVPKQHQTGPQYSDATLTPDALKALQNYVRPYRVINFGGVDVTDFANLPKYIGKGSSIGEGSSLLRPESDDPQAPAGPSVHTVPFGTSQETWTPFPNKNQNH